MIPFSFKENRFSFFVADHLLVGKLCTNPKSDRSLLSRLKVTQCSMREIRDAPLSTDPSYDNRTIASTLKMQIWIAPNNRDVPRVMKTKFPATVIVSTMVSSEGHIMPPHIFEVGLKVNTKVYLEVLEECGDPLVQSGGRWQTLGVAAGLGAGPQVQRDPGFATEGVLRLCTLLSLPHLPEPAGLLPLVIR